MPRTLSEQPFVFKDNGSIMSLRIQLEVGEHAAVQLGQWMQSVRYHTQTTVRALSMAVDISAPRLSEFEMGKRLPTLDEQERIIDWLVKHQQEEEE